MRIAMPTLMRCCAAWTLSGMLAGAWGTTLPAQTRTVSSAAPGFSPSDPGTPRDPLLRVVAARQAPATNQVFVGDPFGLLWDVSPTATPAGLILTYRVYSNGVLAVTAIPAPVTGVYTVLQPAFTAAGSRTYRVSAAWTITDPVKWQCPTGSGDATKCHETFFAPDTVVTAVVRTTTPPAPVPPLLPPGNVRIVVKATATGRLHNLDVTVPESGDPTLVFRGSYYTVQSVTPLKGP